MFHPSYLSTLIGLLLFFSHVVYGSENATYTDVPVDALVNLTGNNDLWTILLKDCQKPTLTCVQNNIFNYLKKTLDESDDLQFTSFMKFTKNRIKYDTIQEKLSNDTDNEDNSINDDEFPIEAMSRTLHDNAAKFLMTHDLEVSLPNGLLPNSILKIAPKYVGNSGTLVNLEIFSKDLENSALETNGRTFKKIRKFINEKIIYAILALLLVIKLLAFKFLFLLPLIVGAATAKKLLLKILLFVFPFLHHIFKFCAYYPIQAKFHHHKHLISHIHQIAPHHHDHPEGAEVYGPPTDHHGHETHFTEFDDDVSVLPDDGSGFPHGLIGHRKDPTHSDNEISSYGQVHSTRRKPNRPMTSIEIERMIAKAEKEAIIKSRLEKERLRIREENLKLQEQLNQAIKLQEKLKQQALYVNKKLPPTKITSSVPYGNKFDSVGNPPLLKGSPFEFGGLDLPPGYIPQHVVPQKPQNTPTFDQSFNTNQFVQQYPTRSKNIDQQFQTSQVEWNKVGLNNSPVYKASPTTQKPQISSGSAVSIQKSVEYDPRIGTFDNSKEVIDIELKANNTKGIMESSSVKIGAVSTTVKPSLEKYPTNTHDPFYSPILQKIDAILQELGFIEEACKERLICSMYKNPTGFSPHSNLLSAELSREASELEKPTFTNSAVVRFYKYVQAARDGQDQRDCLRLYPACAINTEIS
ncbi:hypothetical protein ABEB36_010210 [Hypothenemus hampei]|uniref:Uncharacterized protein n=1 Tax=Hypothenemus hampei TaxID=57062 RepID=A0ABD1EJC3_HYPHA